MLAEYGFMVFYRGYARATLKQALATAFRMGSYNVLKNFEKSCDNRQDTTFNFAKGAVPGTVTTYAT